MKKEKEMTFELQIARLEEIVSSLDNGDLPLDDSLKLFEEGISLTRSCSQQLTEAQGRLEVLVKKQNGTMETKELDI
ncbi:MAG: exodeoxyribonuclease VII small subunit [Armatimonadota bacterium]